MCLLLFSVKTSLGLIQSQTTFRQHFRTYLGNHALTLIQEDGRHTTQALKYPLPICVSLQRTTSGHKESSADKSRMRWLTVKLFRLCRG